MLILIQSIIIFFSYIQIAQATPISSPTVLPSFSPTVNDEILYDCSLYPDFSYFDGPAFQNSIFCSGSQIANKSIVPELLAVGPKLPGGRVTFENSKTFTGQITDDLLVAFRSLSYIQMRGLGLTGSLPSDFSLLKAPADDDEVNLFELDFSANELTGQLPTSYKTLNKLNTLVFWGNKFSGPLDGEPFKDLPSLLLLNLADNDFVGEVSSVLFQDLTGNSSYIRGIHLNGNSFTKLPRELETWIPKDQRGPRDAIYLGNNQWQCDCYLLSWFGPWANANEGMLKDWSNTRCGGQNTFAGLPMASLRMDPYSPCSFPTDLAAPDTTDTSVLVEWNHPEEPAGLAVHFFISVIQSSNKEEIKYLYAGWDFADHVDDVTHSFLVTGLKAYTSYEFIVYPSFLYYDGVVTAIGSLGSNPKTPVELVLNIPGFNVTAENFADLLEQHPELDGPFGDFLGSNSQFLGPSASFIAKEIKKRNRFVNGAGSATLSVITAESTPGSAPANIKQTSRLESGAVIEWDPPSDPRGPVENILYEFEIYEDDNGVFKYFPKNNANNITPSRVVTASGLSFEKLYFIRIRAFLENPPFGAPFGPWSDPLRIRPEDPCPLGTVKVIKNSIATCELCELGFYNDKRGDKACKQCPVERPKTLAKGASNSTLCLAPGGTVYFGTNSSQYRECPTNGICLDSIPITIMQLGVPNGYWRANLLSDSILACKKRNNPFTGQVETFCSGEPTKTIKDETITNLSSIFNSFGNVDLDPWNSSRYCLPHHVGPLCESCELGYAKRQYSCEFCDSSKTGIEVVSLAFIIVGAVLAGLTIFAWNRSKIITKLELDAMADDPENVDVGNLIANAAGKGTLAKNAGLLFFTLEAREEDHLKRHHEMSKKREAHKNIFERNYMRGKRTFEYLRSFVSKDMSIKFKIAFGSVQIAGAYMSLFSDAFPDLFLSVHGWTQTLSFVLPFQVPVGCNFFLSQYEIWLLLSTLVPLFVLLVLYLVSRFYLHFRKDLKRAIDTMFLQSVLLITFTVYPGTSATIFKIFRCQELDGGALMLVADPTVDCRSSRYSIFLGYCIFMILVYPIGGVLLYSSLLYKNRKIFSKYKIQEDIKEEYEVLGKPFREADINPEYLLTTEEFSTMESLNFLWNSYKPKYYYFEVVMLLTKLAETSIAPLVSSRAIIQVLAVAITTFIFLAIFSSARPFSTRENSHLFNVCQACLFFMVFGALLSAQDFMKVSGGTQLARDVLSSILIVLMFVQLLFAIALLLSNKRIAEKTKNYIPLTRLKLLDPEYWMEKSLKLPHLSVARPQKDKGKVGLTVLANVELSSRDLTGAASASAPAEVTALSSQISPKISFGDDLSPEISNDVDEAKEKEEADEKREEGLKNNKGKNYTRVPVSAVREFKRSASIVARKQAWDKMTIEEKMAYINGTQ